MSAHHKRSPWLQTIGSGALDLVNPRPDQINFSTGATVLAGIPRFARHTHGGIYSVGQHLDQGARAIIRDTGRRDWAAAYVLHDWHEYAITDIPTPAVDALADIADEIHVGCGIPVAPHVIVRRALRELKRRLDSAIYPAAGIPWPLPAETHAVVKQYDIRMCRTERDARLGPSPYRWDECYELAEPVKGCDLAPMSETWARCCLVDTVRDLIPACSDLC